MVTTTRKIYVNELTFPVITICNLNTFATEYARKLFNLSLENNTKVSGSSRKQFSNNRFKLIQNSVISDEKDKELLGSNI